MAHSHGGHRSRLRQRAEREGLDAFQPHEVMELMLFPALPQRDVNPLAHELVRLFGSVGGALAAPAAQLAQVPGMGQGSAQWLGLLCQAAQRYASLSLADRPQFDRLYRVKRHCQRLFAEAAEEQVWVFSMNLSGHLLGSTLVCQGSERQAAGLRALVEPLIFYRAQSAVLVQRRDPGNLAPDGWDLEMTGRLARQLGMLNILLLDSVLMAGSTAVSLRKERIYRLAGEGEAALNEAGGLFERWLEEE